MTGLGLTGGGGPLRVLFIGAHSDDIEIGCGGTVRALVVRPGGLIAHWLVLSGTPERAGEARNAAADLLDGAIDATIDVQAFRESYFPYLGSEIKDHFERTARAFTPDVVFTHARHDRHQDHRQVSDLTWNTFRDHLVLEYEIPKWDGDLGTPNLYVALSDDQADHKMRAIMGHFPSQRTKAWFDEATFDGLMRLRGVECNAPARRAEGFYARKGVLAV
jgi:LmbE family N-acetylglucosaminyl deacetylase